MPRKPPSGIQRTVFLTIGQFGAEVLLRLREQLVERYGSVEALPIALFLHLDDQAERVDWLSDSERGPAACRSTECVCLPVSDLAEWLGELRTQPAGRWLPPDVLTLAEVTPEHLASWRGVARALLWRHSQSIAQVLHERLRALLSVAADDYATGVWHTSLTSNVRVYVIGALAGGLASGAHVDLAFMLRRTLRELDPVASPTYVGYLALPSIDRVHEPPWACPNAYAALGELNALAFRAADAASLAEFYASFTWVVPTGEDAAELQLAECAGSPYDTTFLLQLENDAVTLSEQADLVAMVGDALASDLTCELAVARRALEAQLETEVGLHTPEGSPICYSSFGEARVVLPRRAPQKLVASRLALDQLAGWLGLPSGDLALCDWLERGAGTMPVLALARQRLAEARASTTPRGAAPASLDWCCSRDLRQRLMDRSAIPPLGAVDAEDGRCRRIRIPRLHLTDYVQTVWDLGQTALALATDKQEPGEAVKSLFEAAAVVQANAILAIREALCAERASNGVLAEARRLEALRGWLDGLREDLGPAPSIEDHAALDRQEAHRREAVERAISRTRELVASARGWRVLWHWHELRQSEVYTIDAVRAWCQVRAEAVIRWLGHRTCDAVSTVLDQCCEDLERRLHRLAEAGDCVVAACRAEWIAAQERRLVGVNLLADECCRPGLVLDLLQAELATRDGLCFPAEALRELAGVPGEPASLAERLCSTAMESLARAGHPGWPASALSVAGILRQLNPESVQRAAFWRLLIQKAQPYVRLLANPVDTGWKRSAGFPGGPVRQRQTGLPMGPGDVDGQDSVLCEELTAAGWEPEPGAEPLPDGDALRLTVEEAGFPLQALAIVDNYATAWAAAQNTASATRPLTLHPLIAACAPWLLPPKPAERECALAVRALGGLSGVLREEPWPGGPRATRIVWDDADGVAVPLAASWAGVAVCLAGQPRLREEVQRAAEQALAQLDPAEMAARSVTYLASYRAHVSGAEGCLRDPNVPETRCVQEGARLRRHAEWSDQPSGGESSAPPE